MNSVRIEKALELMHDRDAAKFKSLKAKHASLLKQACIRMRKISSNEFIFHSISDAHLFSKHCDVWREEAHSFSQAALDMEPEIAAARENLKKSFGKLVTIRSLKNPR